MSAKVKQETWGAVHKLSGNNITIVQKQGSIDEVIDNYTRSKQC